MTGLPLLAFSFGPALAGAVLAMGFDAFGRRTTALGVAAAGLLASGAVAMWAGWSLPAEEVLGVARLGGPFSAVPGVVMICSALALLGGWTQFAERDGGGSAAALVAILGVSSAAVAASNNLVMLLLCLEIAAAASYALVADARSRSADEASMKYFVQGAIATGLLVLGLAVLVGAYSPDGSYAVLGTVLEKPTPANPALLGVLLVVSALAFKIAASPFSAWAPDAYQSARSEVASALSSAPKLGAIGALALFVVVASTGALARQLLVPLALLSVLSVVVGSVGALRQRSYTRMLGYASVAQTGYALIGVAVLSPTAAVFFAATYALATTGTFMAATAFRRMRPDWDGTIDGLGGLGRTAPRTALGLSLLLVSLAGIPPMLGFWGKLQVFGAAVLAAGRAFSVGGDSASGAVYALLAVVGVVGSVISLAYYGSVLRALYFEREAGEACDPSESESGAAGWAVFGLGVLLLVLGLMPIVFGVATVLRPFVVR